MFRQRKDLPLSQCVSFLPLLPKENYADSEICIGVWQKPKRGHAPLAVLFDQTSRSDKVFTFTEKAVNGHMGACSNGLMELTKRIDRARKRHVGLRLLAGKAA